MEIRVWTDLLRAVLLCMGLQSLQMDFSDLFNSAEEADVHLTLGIEPTDGANATRKRGREEDDEVSRVLFLHRLILTRSEFFSAMIKRWNFATPSASGRIELVVRVSWTWHPLHALTNAPCGKAVPSGQLDVAELASHP